MGHVWLSLCMNLSAEGSIFLDGTPARAADRDRSRRETRARPRIDSSIKKVFRATDVQYVQPMHLGKK